jgi:hypothetical protein
MGSDCRYDSECISLSVSLIFSLKECLERLEGFI